MTALAGARPAAFGQRLLNQVELCYSVALALVRNPKEAETLARETLEWGWNLPRGVRDDRALKMVLLTELRRRFNEANVPTSQSRNLKRPTGSETRQ